MPVGRNIPSRHEGRRRERELPADGERGHHLRGASARPPRGGGRPGDRHRAGGRFPSPVRRIPRPDVVHVAAPFLLGAQAIAAANRLGVPSVAISCGRDGRRLRRPRGAGEGARAADRPAWASGSATRDRRRRPRDAAADACPRRDAGTEETAGQTLQEAQASGLPVIAPRVGGPLDLVEHGVNGLLYDPASESDLRSAVAALATAPELRARMGEAGRRRVLGRSWTAVCDDLVGFYAQVVTARALAVSRA
jgi:hypothetical protein